MQSFLFPPNLKFLNTFLIFLIISIRFDLPRSGDPIQHLLDKSTQFSGHQHHCKLSSIRVQNEFQESVFEKALNSRCYLYVLINVSKSLHICLKVQSASRCTITTPDYSFWRLGCDLCPHVDVGEGKWKIYTRAGAPRTTQMT